MPVTRRLSIAEMQKKEEAKREKTNKASNISEEIKQLKKILHKMELKCPKPKKK